MRYANGSLVRVSGTFRNTNTQALQDPDAVYCAVTPPGGVETVYEAPNVVHVGTGQYYYEANGNIDGTWTYRWYSTGTGQAAEESTFYIY